MIRTSRSRAAMIAVVVLPLAAGCVRMRVERSTSRETTVERIAAAAREFSSLYERGDAAAMAAIYTEDGIIFPPGREAITGREAIERYWRLAPGQRVISHRTISDSIVVSDSIAYDWGTYTVSGARNGERYSGGGKYVIVWREVRDGVWRMHLDMWNSGPPRTP